MLKREAVNLLISLMFVFGILILAGAADSGLSLLETMGWGLFGISLMGAAGFIGGRL